MIPRIAWLFLPLLAVGLTPLGEYNEGVKKLESGEIPAAIGDFEKAAAAGDPKIATAALVNLALCHARAGDAIRTGEKKGETRDERITRLGEAAGRYRTALAIFRRVPPPAPDAAVGARAVKVRLLGVLDTIEKLTEEARREAEEKALRNPPALLLTLLTGERDRRRGSARIGSLDRRYRRRPARILRRSEYSARLLAEKLAVALQNSPGPGGRPSPGGKTAPAPGKGSGPPASPEAVAAASDVEAAAKAMARAESRLDGADAQGAVEEQTRAVGGLAAAARRLPAPLPTLVAKLLDDQTSLLSMTEGADPAVLPAEQKEIGAWLETLEALPDPAPGAPAGLDPAKRKTLRKAAGEARAASGRARERLLAHDLPGAAPEERKVVEKLTEIRDLFPKPPPSPAERIRKLLDAERKAGKSISALKGLSEKTRRVEEGGIAGPQREHGREATSVAQLLEKAAGEREKAAAEKVREAEGEIFSSAESLDRDRAEEAGTSVKRAIDALEEALRRISGKQGKKSGRPDQDRQGPGPKQDRGKEAKREKEKPGRLDLRAARRMIAEMDRRRREEERKLFPGGGGPRVDKDW